MSLPALPSPRRACRTGIATYMAKNSNRNGSVVANFAGEYCSAPHTVPMPNVKANPSRFSTRHGRVHAIATMPALSTA